MPFHPQGCKTLFRRSWTRHVKSVRKGKYKMTLEELLKKQGLFHAATITGSSAISQYLPDFNQPGAVKDGEVEMVAATVLKNTKHAGVLRNVKIA